MVRGRPSYDSTASRSGCRSTRCDRTGSPVVGTQPYSLGKSPPTFLIGRTLFTVGGGPQHASLVSLLPINISRSTRWPDEQKPLASQVATRERSIEGKGKKKRRKWRAGGGGIAVWPCPWTLPTCSFAYLDQCFLSQRRQVLPKKALKSAPASHCSDLETFLNSQTLRLATW